MNLMRNVLALVCGLGLLSQVTAQDTGRKPSPPDEPKPTEKKDFSNSPIVTKMMSYAKGKDGTVKRDDVTDTRLLRLFDMADTKKEGVVTKEQLMALAAKLDEEYGPAGGGRGGPGGDSRGGPGGDGPGGPGGPGGGRGGPGGGGPVVPEAVAVVLVVAVLVVPEAVVPVAPVVVVAAAAVLLSPASCCRPSFRSS